MGSKIEDELLGATSYDYDGTNQQEYLLGLLHAVEKLDDDTYDKLTDKACGWAKKAVSAHNNRKPIPDFPDLEEVTDDEPSVDAGEEVPEDKEPVSMGSPQEVVEDSGPVQVDPKPKGKGGRKKNPNTKRVEPSKAKVEHPETGELVSPKDLMSFDKDKWGHVKGSKASLAMEMYERGTTPREITEKLGGKHYNVMRKAGKEGHRVEKEDGVIKVTHKDDFGKQAKGK